MTTKVTVIIPTIQKTHDYLLKTVESLRAAEVSKYWDIIVVSNGGPMQPWPQLPFRRYHVNKQGQCIAVNRGYQFVDPLTTHIMISNDDMYYAPDWGENLNFDNPVFSPNLVEPTDNAGSAPPFLKLDGGLTLDEFKQEVVDQFVSEHEAEGTTTGFNFPVFIRRDIWETIGGYDEKYDPWGSNSDTDLQTKIELAGIQPYRLRDVLVYHFGSKSGTFDPDKQSFWQKNWDYYTNKWGFNRDMKPLPDTWMATNLVNHKLNKFHPEWEGRYKEEQS